MKRSQFTLLALLIAGLTTAGCETPVDMESDDPTSVIAAQEQPPNGSASKATVDQFHVLFPLPLALGIPCIQGEVAIGGGVRHLRMQNVTNDNGFVFRFHLNHNRITGVGTVTGTEYVGQLVINETFVSFAELGETQTFQQHLHGVSKGPGPNFVVTMLTHLTLASNGDIAADTEVVKAECRG